MASPIDGGLPVRHSRSRLLAGAESCPERKANRNFLHLQQLSSMEEKPAAYRLSYFLVMLICAAPCQRRYIMKKICVFLTLTMLICLLSACGSTSPSGPSTTSTSAATTSAATTLAATTSATSKPTASTTSTSAATTSAATTPAATSQSTAESTRTDILYAVFHSSDVREYPLTYSGAPKTAEELAHALSELTGLDFFITAAETDDGWIVDWAADSALVAGGNNREQKEEFFFFDCDSLSWFMMDSLWRTLTENLDAENIYYTMDGGRELVLEKMSPAFELPSDIPYMGSAFYSAHDDVRGDEEDLYARTKGLWRMDGATDTASIEMDGEGGFTLYYADGSVEAAGYLECIDEYENGDFRYDCYTAEGEWIVSFYFDSDTQLHIGNEDGSVYLLETLGAYQGFWAYPDGKILEIRGGQWKLYENDGETLLAEGPTAYMEDAAFLMNEDGSSGGGRVFFNEDGELKDSGDVLTFLGLDDSVVPKG